MIISRNDFVKRPVQFLQLHCACQVIKNAVGDVEEGGGEIYKMKVRGDKARG